MPIVCKHPRTAARTLLLAAVCIALGIGPAGTARAQYLDRTGQSAYRTQSRTAGEYRYGDPLTAAPVQGDVLSFAIRYPGQSRFALKTNAIYLATLTPNLGFEAALGRRTSLEFSFGYNPWQKEGKEFVIPPNEVDPERTIWENGTRSVHWQVKGEFRYWFDEAFSRHFVGLSLLYGDFDWGGKEMPFLFEKEFFYDGNGFGGGLLYGYHIPLSRKWRLELTAGFGLIRLEYDKMESDHPEATRTRFQKNYYGPTQLGAKLVFMIR